MDALKKAIREQKETAKAVQDGGFPGLSVIVEELTLDAKKVTSELIASDNMDDIRSKQAELRVIKRLLDRYQNWLMIEI